MTMKSRYFNINNVPHVEAPGCHILFLHSIYPLFAPLGLPLVNIFVGHLGLTTFHQHGFYYGGAGEVSRSRLAHLEGNVGWVGIVINSLRVLDMSRLFSHGKRG